MKLVKDDIDEREQDIHTIPNTYKIMITGAGGFIGSHLLRGLQKECKEIIAVDIKEYGDWKIFDMGDPRAVKGKIYASFDMNVRSELCRLLSTELPDIIFNFAGIPIPKMYVTQTEKVIESVLHSFISLKHSIEAMRFLKTEQYCPLIIQASTSEVYGNNETYIEDESPRVYGDISSRRWCYALSKAMIEEMLAAGDLPWIALRLFNIVGPNIDSWGEGRVLTKMIGGAINNHEIIVTDDGTQIRAFTHVEDFMMMIREIIRLHEPASRHINNVFNIGGVCNAISMMDLAILIADSIKNRIGIQVKITKMPADKFYGKRFSDIQYRVPDMTKWESHYTSVAKIPMRYIIDEMVIAAAKHYKLIILNGDSDE